MRIPFVFSHCSETDRKFPHVFFGDNNTSDPEILDIKHQTSRFWSLILLWGIASLFLLSDVPISAREGIRRNIRSNKTVVTTSSSNTALQQSTLEGTLANPEEKDGAKQSLANRGNKIPGFAVSGVSLPSFGSKNGSRVLQNPANYLSAPTSAKIYEVGTDRLLWRVNGSFVTVSAKVYYPVNREGTCPVIIFSHGLGGSSERCGYLGRMWASRGMISIHPEHHGSNEEIWRGKVRAKEILSDAYKKCWNGRDRALTIRFIIDRLLQPDETAIEHPCLAHVDTNRIGVCGNDLGALAAMLLAGQLPPDNGVPLKDERVKAILALSPPVFCQQNYAPLVYSNIDVPFMSFGGTSDDGIIGTTKAYQRRIPYDNIRGTDKYHITLQGADHMVYTGMRFRLQSPQISDDEFQRTIMDVSTLFWSLYLDRDESAQALLRTGPNQSVLRQAVLERQVYR